MTPRRARFGSTRGSRPSLDTGVQAARPIGPATRGQGRVRCRLCEAQCHRRPQPFFAGCSAWSSIPRILLTTRAGLAHGWSTSLFRRCQHSTVSLRATATAATWWPRLARIRTKKACSGPEALAAASILTAVYHMLRDGTFYHDLGPDHFRRTLPEDQANRLLQPSSRVIRRTPQPRALSRSIAATSSGSLICSPDPQRGRDGTSPHPRPSEPPRAGGGSSSSRRKRSSFTCRPTASTGNG